MHMNDKGLRYRMAIVILGVIVIAYAYGLL